MERAEFQHEQKANVRNSGEGLSVKTDSNTETKDLLKNKRPLTRVCIVRQSSRTYPTSPSERYADFGKCKAVMQNFCHSENARAEDGRRSRYLFSASAGDSESEKFCLSLAYSESVNADEKPNKVDENHNNVIQNYIKRTETFVILNLIQDLLIPMVINNQTNRFRIKSGMTLLREMHLYGMPQKHCSYLSGMTHNSGLPRSLALTRNDVKTLVPFSPFSLSSPSVLLRSHKTGTAIAFHPLLACARGEGHRKVAFTLAEVLITLGIIGVVAAMTIPNLIQSFQKRIFAKNVKASYSILSQALRMSIQENGTPDGWDFGNTVSVNNMDNMKSIISEKFALTYFAPYLKVIEQGKSNTDGGGYGYYLKILNGTTFFFRLDGHVSESENTYTPGLVYIVANYNNNFTPMTDKSRDYSRHDVVFQLVPSDKSGSIQFFNWGGSTRNGVKNNSIYACNKNIAPNKRLNCGKLLFMDNFEIRSDFP